MQLKSIFIFLSGCLLTVVSLQAQPGPIPGRKVQYEKVLPIKGEHYTWSTRSYSWYNDVNLALAYDKYGNISTYVQLRPGSGDSLYMVKYAYNMQGVQTINDYYAYDAQSGWQLREGWHVTYSYNNMGKLASEESQSYSSSSGWSSPTKMTYTYNGRNLTEKITQWWNSTTSQWVDLEVETYAYYNNGLAQVNKKKDIGGVWQTEKYDQVRISDATGEWEHYVKLAPAPGGVWANSEQWDIGYDPDGRLITTMQLWQDSAWHNSNRFIKTWDSYGNIVSDLEQAWDGTFWYRTNETVTDYTYDGDKMLDNTVQKWVPSASVMRNAYKTIYTDFATVAITSTAGIAENNDVRIYPNPIHNILNIETANHLYRTATLTDLSGRTIMMQQIQPGDNTLRMDMSNLQSGVYLLQLQGDKESAVQKVLKK